MSARPELIDFIAFFESDPDWVHENGWHYGARFAVARGEDRLSVTIAPDEAEFDLLWMRDGHRLLGLSLKMVVYWEIERRGNAEHLLLRINTGPDAICSFEYFLLRLKPNLEVDCRMTWGPGWPPASEPTKGGRRASGLADR